MFAVDLAMNVSHVVRFQDCEQRVRDSKLDFHSVIIKVVECKFLDYNEEPNTEENGKK